MSADLPPELHVRPARDEDADALIDLVGGVYAEYPGCVLDLDGVDADLLAPRTTAERRGGELWVVEDPDGAVVACAGWAPSALDGESAVELKRVYVAPRARRRGVAAALVRRVEGVARTRGAAVVEAWSDTRFGDAHRLYARLGYDRLPRTRHLGDPSDTTEYHFARTLADDGPRTG